MARLPTPEELLSNPESPPLDLVLRCGQCGKESHFKFDFAVVHPNRDQCRKAGWDGVLLSRAVECRECKAIDEYELTARAEAVLMGHGLRSIAKEAGGSRVVFGESRLFDGTVTRRPSQAVAHLRALAEKSPRDAALWRRLGNTLERFGSSDEAAQAWRKAVEVDPEEFEATYSLATLAGDRGEFDEAFARTSAAIALLPKSRSIEGERLLFMADSLARLLRDLLDGADGPVALMALWQVGESKRRLLVNTSSVDLRRLTARGWERLPEFLTSPRLLSAGLTPDLPENDETILERELNGGAGPLDVEAVEIVPTPAIGEARVAANAKCPCGSGKKYKRCCGR